MHAEFLTVTKNNDSKFCETVFRTQNLLIFKKLSQYTDYKFAYFRENSDICTPKIFFIFSRAVICRLLHLLGKGTSPVRCIEEKFCHT